MKKIKDLMKEQIEYMFLNNGERNAVIDNRLSTLIADYCNGDEDLDKISEVEETWKDLVLTRYNFTVNEILNNAI